MGAVPAPSASGILRSRVVPRNVGQTVDASDLEERSQVVLTFLVNGG